MRSAKGLTGEQRQAEECNGLLDVSGEKELLFRGHPIRLWYMKDNC